MNVPLLIPQNRLRLNAALDWFHTGHRDHSGFDWIVARDRRDHPVRVALASGTPKAWLLTEEGYQVGIPPKLWAGKVLWSEAYSRALVKARIDGRTVTGYLVIDKDAFVPLVKVVDADAISQSALGLPTPNLPAPSPPAWMLLTDAELSPYLRLMIAFSHARAGLFGTEPYLKSEVMVWFAEHWPEAMEADWPAADRERALQTNQNWPRLVQEMAGLVFMQHKERKGGRLKGRASQRRR